MSERDAIDRVEEPVTVDRLVADLRELGLAVGDTVIVHSSMSSLGWVSGGPPAVVDALQAVVTRSGTIVMPTHTGQNSDPADWTSPPVPDDWVDTIRETRPAYRPAVTPSRGVGAVPECFRTYPDAVRSRHPEVSFAAWGADAEAVVADHEYAYSLGEGSPLADVYERDGMVLMLGTDHATNTSLHLAEYRAVCPTETVTCAAPVEEAGERVVVEYEDVVTDTEDFPEVGAAAEQDLDYERGTVGAASAKLFSQPELVDFAIEWFERHR